MIAVSFVMALLTSSIMNVSAIMNVKMPVISVKRHAMILADVSMGNVCAIMRLALTL